MFDLHLYTDLLNARIQAQLTAAIAPQEPAKSPPETNMLTFTLPSAVQFKRSLPSTFKGADPTWSIDQQTAYKVWEDLVRAAAHRPLKDWKFTETASAYHGYKNTVWGYREYVLRDGDRAYRVEEEIEEGYGGRICSATCVLAFDKLTKDPRFSGSRCLLYANDDWGALPIKILEDRITLAARRLPKRSLFGEAVLDAHAFATHTGPGRLFTQPAPVKIEVPLELGFGASWKGHGPSDAIERQVYLKLLGFAATTALEAWTFTEEISEGFGKRSQLWGVRRFALALGTARYAIEEQVIHNGEFLESHCNLVISEPDHKAPAQWQFTGGWAELPYQYLERRREGALQLLPWRLPFVSTPNTPGSFVK